MKILAAMSGGVDSSVAALLLKEQGHEVTGVTMKLWGGESDTGCCSVSDVEDARRTADAIHIDHFVFNFGDEFEKKVVEPYADSYKNAETPNPCIECNRHIKFQTLLKRAAALGFDALATGHHARIVSEKDESGNDSLWLARGADPDKDQSYVLNMLTPQQLEYVLFPIGHLTKTQVRQIAKERNLPVAQKPDSYEVCFIKKTEGKAEFLSKKMGFTPASIVDASGEKLGAVPALELLTVGQRKGTGIQGKKEPLYVTKIQKRQQKVTVGKKADLLVQKQFLRDLRLRDLQLKSLPKARLLKSDANSRAVNLYVQCSAHASAQPAQLIYFEAGSEDKPHLLWKSPQKLIAPGQSLVFYIRGRKIKGQKPETAEKIAGSAIAK